MVATGSDDSYASIWRVPNGPQLRILQHGFRVLAVAFSPDNRLLASGALDGMTRLWNITNATDTRILESGDTLALAFSPDGKLLLTASAGVLKFWRVADGALVATFDEEMQGAATAVDISPDGRLYAYGRGDSTVLVARMPLWIESITRTNGEVTLRWQGGSGLYQLQTRSDLVGGSWKNLGVPTTNTLFTHTGLSPQFYRVQSLPIP